MPAKIDGKLLKDHVKNNHKAPEMGKERNIVYFWCCVKRGNCYNLWASMFNLDDESDTETLLKHNDSAIYEAKLTGRGGYRFFKPEMLSIRKISANM